MAVPAGRGATVTRSASHAPLAFRVRSRSALSKMAAWRWGTSGAPCYGAHPVDADIQRTRALATKAEVESMQRRRRECAPPLHTA